jgi:uncharacterized RDD family membrane protein YckC
MRYYCFAIPDIMQTITVQTSQNIDIEYELAGVGDRMVAYLLDFLIYSAYFIVVILIMQNVGRSAGFFYQVIAIMPILFYQLICEVFMNGQSIGKKVKNIRVVSLDGNQPHIGQYIIRWLFRIVDTMMSTGLVAIMTIALTSKGQRIGDMLAGTTVVRTNRKTQIDDTLFMETEEDYQVKYPESVNLSDQDITLLKEVLNRESKSYNESSGLTMKAALKVKNMLNIHSNDDPRIFLEDIIRDYNFLTSKEV